MHALDVKTGKIEWIWDLGQEELSAEELAKGESRPLQLVRYVDQTGLNSSIFTVQNGGHRFVAYRLFGQYYR